VVAAGQAFPISWQGGKIVHQFPPDVERVSKGGFRFSHLSTTHQHHAKVALANGEFLPVCRHRGKVCHQFFINLHRALIRCLSFNLLLELVV
jgi:hypothetical protein